MLCSVARLWGSLLCSHLQRATCLLDIQRVHSVHKCAEIQCLHPCVIQGCKANCGAKDHFHGQAESRGFAKESGITHVVDLSEDTVDENSLVTTTHQCLGTHACPELCQADGICEQKVHLKKSSRTYKGARSSFEYVFQEMNGCKKACSRVIPSTKRNHKGIDHSCAGHSSKGGNEIHQVTIHYCAVRCPCCNYFCNKEFGHMGLHATSHGNMQQTYFMAKSNEIEIDLDDRKYEVGERGVADMCNIFCTKMGRGHYVTCGSEGGKNCVYRGDASKDKRRHCVVELYPPPDKAMDELLHDQFWTTIGWEDPCSEEERVLFAKCPFQCNAPEHDEEGNPPSYCVLDAWHLPKVKSVMVDDGFSYVDGHKFECVHAVDSGKFHNIFVLDSSTSMRGDPWRNLVCAWKQFVSNRLQAGGKNDLVSCITFDRESFIRFEGVPINDALQIVLPYSGAIGTNFTAGLSAAREVLSRNNLEEFKAVLIFFSDGYPQHGQSGIRLAQYIRSTYAKYDLKAFTVGFGCANFSMLQRMAAEIGEEYQEALDVAALKTEFERIAAVLHNNEASLVLKDQCQSSVNVRYPSE